MSNPPKRCQRPPPDRLLVDLAAYACNYDGASDLAWDTAHHCLLDSLACAFQALAFPACTKLLGPVVPGATMARGALAEARPPPLVRDVLRRMIQAYEIQGVLALDHAFNRVGLDHVLLVRVASTAVVTAMLGGTQAQVVDALSNAWLDGGALRAYRHAPNTGSRKGWAAGDAASRAVRLALLAMAGEMGYSAALTARAWGFQDVLFGGRPIALAQPLGCHVMENVLFKPVHPAEFHAQSAVECALRLHPQVCARLEDVERVVLDTQEPGVRILDKRGPLANPADRDHCLQYLIAVPLIFGRLAAVDYEDAVAADPRIDALRAKMEVRENAAFSADYRDPARRAIANAVQAFFRDGSATERVQVDFPLGHRRRRAEGEPLRQRKFEAAVVAHFKPAQAAKILASFADRARLEAMPVNEMVSMLVRN